MQLFVFHFVITHLLNLILLMQVKKSLYIKGRISTITTSMLSLLDLPFLFFLCMNHHRNLLEIEDSQFYPPKPQSSLHDLEPACKMLQ